MPIPRDINKPLTDFELDYWIKKANSRENPYTIIARMGRELKQLRKEKEERKHANTEEWSGTNTKPQFDDDIPF